MPPLVSICVPNLNTRPYLPERFATIFDQTYANWEIIVSDNFSEDGAWEYFQELARNDSRISIAQAPRAGMYANWNNCIRRARGEYVYVATSDDTMAPDFLARTVQALEEHPECDLAHTLIRMVGDGAADLQRGWEEGLIFARSSGELLRKPHVRRAPFDGLLHLSGATVFTSITQLLVRRTLFDRIGYFEGGWGSVGDFNWDMRASLVASTVHVPQTWGGWRIHHSQATSAVDYRSKAHEIRIDEMIEHALETSGPLLAPTLGARLRTEWAPFAREMRHLIREASSIESAAGRWVFHTGKAMGGSRAAARHILSRLAGRAVWPASVPGQVREWLSSEGIQEPLSPGADPALAARSEFQPLQPICPIPGEQSR
ncbi:MAG TPA: glycosyltransferase family 2 protein [Verrucomicrobiae bacterium]|nr:glycosyltransferase family 2 protein [Verrucomicrobiae bacterium]